MGVGQKYYLLFSVAEILDLAGICHEGDAGGRVNYCYVVFEVSQFDDASYLQQALLRQPQPRGGEVDFDPSGIRLGINGKLARVGQAFVNVSAGSAAAASVKRHCRWRRSAPSSRWRTAPTRIFSSSP